MQYRNKRTGAVIDVESKVGGDWEPVTDPAAHKTETKKTEPVKKKGPAKK
jgi:hypothetical protein